MFYDAAFKQITESSAFSEKATLTVGENSYTLYGFFCSGNYGDKEFDKGYSLRKTLRQQSFKISLASLPEGVSVADLARRPLSVRNTAFVIDEVTGNDSGILCLSLKAGTANG